MRRSRARCCDCGSRASRGKQHDIACGDPKLVRVVKRMQDLPGQHLFQYVDDEGDPVPVSSHDVNGYIHEVMGAQFTAKNFRTWTSLGNRLRPAAGGADDGAEGDAADRVRPARQHASDRAQVLCPPRAAGRGQARRGDGRADAREAATRDRMAQRGGTRADHLHGAGGAADSCLDSRPPTGQCRAIVATRHLASKGRNR